MEVNFDKDTGILELEGASYPENALDFFGPIVEWIKNYISEIKKPFIMNIRINYINTSSTKCMLDMFEMLQEYYASGVSIKINWFYEKDDEDIMETGEEIGEGLDLPIEYIPY
jgi:hypothetical protein